MGSEQTRFLLPQQPPAPRHKRWGRCWGGLSCFGKQKGGKRIVPSRNPDANSLGNQQNGHQVVGLPNQTGGINPSLLAPPSSPASFSNSALSSTVQSPTFFLSANSPGGPSSTMFVTGPYAHETQLVSPPVFSNFTTEPSTAPRTPTPELAHLTTPSSPEVPYAHFLSSSLDLKNSNKTTYISGNDLQATYSLYPGSPASTLRSPASDGLSSPFPENDFTSQWDHSVPSQETAYTETKSGSLPGHQPAGGSKLRQDSNFFCPETFAQFYLDQSSLSLSGGRLSISKESDAYSNGGNGYQNRHGKASKPDVEEIEAYRASFGFSADEIITTTQYVEISDVGEDSFTMMPLTSSKPAEDHILTAQAVDGPKTEKRKEDFSSLQHSKIASSHAERMHSPKPHSHNAEDHVPKKRFTDISARSSPGYHIRSDDDDILSRKGPSKANPILHIGSSNSDAELEYRRGRSLREARGLRES